MRPRRLATRLLAGVAGFGLGAAAGWFVGELVGSLDRERMRRSIHQRRTRSGDARGPDDPRALERAALDRLRADASTRHARLRVRALAPGAVELVGWVESEDVRRRAERAVRGAPGVRTVVNRTLVTGIDDRPPGPGPSDAV